MPKLSGQREEPSVMIWLGRIREWRCVLVVSQACLVLGAFLWLQNRPVPDLPVAQTHLGSDTSAADLASLFELPKGADLSELSRKLNWPLETEMQMVVTDAKTAMNYLADSFLPERLRQAAFNESAP